MNNLSKLFLAKYAKGRCWDGYEPVPGKKPYSDDSCRPVGSKKKKKKKKEEKKESKEKYATVSPSKDEAKKNPSQTTTKQRRLAVTAKPKAKPVVQPKEPSRNVLLEMNQPKPPQHVLPYVLGGNFKKDVSRRGKGLLSDLTGLEQRTIDRIGDIGEMGLKQRADFKLGPWDITAGRTGNFDRGGLEISRSF